MLRRMWARWWPSWPGVILAGGLGGLFLIGLATAAAIHSVGWVDHAAPADAIVVLGAGIEEDLTMTPPMQRRVDHAVALYRAGYAPVVVCTGGYTSGRPIPEAQSCASDLAAQGVPAAAIRVEALSRSTEENAIEIGRMVQAEGWRGVLVVTDNFHLLRAEFLFQRYTVPVVDFSPAQATTGPVPLLEYLSMLAREVTAVFWETFKTILGLPFTYVP